MKKIRNWKVIADKIDITDALKILMNQKYENYTGPFAIQSYCKQYDSWGLDMGFTVNEAINPWKVLVPDTDEEVKNEKIRQMVKDSNCSGLSYDKIDNMTTRELFKHIVNHVSEDQMYRMLKLYYSEKVYKEK